MHQLRAFPVASILVLLACEPEPQAPQTRKERPAPPAEPPTVAIPRVTSANLWRAVVEGDNATVATGLSQGIDANLTTSEGVTALMVAAARGNDGSVAALLARGARPNDFTNRDHLTPLMFGAYACSRPVIDRLLAAKADAKLKDSAGGSAADWAFRGCEDPKQAADLMEHLHKNGAGIQPRGDALGLFLAEGTRPPIDEVLTAARSAGPKP